MQIVPSPSPNFNDRADGKTATILIMHYTDLPDGKTSVDWMCDPEKKVSSHYMVDTDGTIYQLVDESKRAWHAGVSYWQGETDLNSCSIGIEIQNTGHSLGYVPFPDKQIDAVRVLSADIIKRNHILPRHVLAHSDIAPLRKIDPGHLFPWHALAQDGIGFWPLEAAPEADTNDILHILGDFGYDTSIPFEKLIEAFQRHFEPEVFTHDHAPGMVTPRTLQRIGGMIGC
ncbi:MAG TPA: N-acetylmuramoyl-L-alanine amidase [Alphaproteobacteria bacterium]|nr:N-acetylmuramoyl-L-alanine amidase [Alphaproteobacteria bacterium]